MQMNLLKDRQFVIVDKKSLLDTRKRVQVHGSRLNSLEQEKREEEQQKEEQRKKTLSDYYTQKLNMSDIARKTMCSVKKAFNTRNQSLNPLATDFSMVITQNNTTPIGMHETVESLKSQKENSPLQPQQEIILPNIRDMKKSMPNG